MASMNAGIILAGQPLNALSALNAGTTAARNTNQVRQENALTDLYRTQGPGLMSGDANALNALSRLNPEAAFGLRADQERLQLAQAAGARAAASAAASQSAAERAAQEEQIRRGLDAARTAQTAEEWDALAVQFGAEDLVGQFDQRDAVIAFYEGYSAPQAPSYHEFDGNLYAETPGGLEMAIEGTPEAGFRTLTPDEIAQRGLEPGSYQIGPDDRIYSIGSGGQTFNIYSGEGALPPGAPAAPPPDPVDGANEVFGGYGVFTNVANTAADAVGLNLPYPDAQDAAASVGLLADQLTQDLAAGYDRQPPSWLMQSIRDNIPESGRITVGPGRARSQYTAILNDLESELETQERALQLAIEGQDARVVTAVQNRITSIQTSMGRIRAVLSGLAPDQAVTLSEEDQALVDRWAQ